ncbi:protein Tob1-like [Caligus rogercresseyi]|uniref:Protein Tob1-like n=1 Tax=Caligus rogercresseyi TaxID=217165 RepID=A0A7T8HMD9_CALRO|nr:protein Tob1-like [Caligus rogercresseyi]
MFAQTKFGSPKLKTIGKTTSRMSPTEFSNYIKTRAALQSNSSTTQRWFPNMRATLQGRPL